MHELKRRAYLDVMGIPTYVSRRPLPGAAPSSKLILVKRAKLAGRIETPGNETPGNETPGNETPGIETPVPQLDQAVAATPAIPRIELAGAAKVERTGATGKPGATERASPAIEFRINAFQTGHWLWLEALPLQQALMRDQVLLIQAMAQALGWHTGKPDIAQFNWPIHTNNQLDLGEDAARASLGGFVSRKLAQADCRGLVVLGSTSQHWLAADQLEVAAIVTTLSTAQMLHDPSLKKQAWRDLLPYAN